MWCFPGVSNTFLGEGQVLGLARPLFLLGWPLRLSSKVFRINCTWRRVLPPNL